MTRTSGATLVILTASLIILTASEKTITAMAFALGALWAALAALALATAGGVQGAGQTRGRAPVWAKRGPSRGLSAAPPRRPLPLDPASALSLPARPPAAAATATAAAAAAPPTLPPPARPPAAALTLEDYRSKNVVLFISDQERATQHFPVGWEAENMPATTALKKNGETYCSRLVMNRVVSRPS